MLNINRTISIMITITKLVFIFLAFALATTSGFSTLVPYTGSVKIVKNSEKSSKKSEDPSSNENDSAENNTEDFDDLNDEVAIHIADSSKLIVFKFSRRLVSLLQKEDPSPDLAKESEPPRA